MSWYSTQAQPLESDEALRARLLYVAADGMQLTTEIHRALGQALDDLAARFNLRRRGT